MKLSAEDVAFLQGIPIFGGLGQDALDGLAVELKEHAVPTGALVVSEGDLARELYIVRSGLLEVIKDAGAGQAARLALLRPGSCFGEMALVDIEPRSAGVRAVEASTLLGLSGAALAKLRRENPAVYTLVLMNVAREISRRLRRADRLIAAVYRVVAGLDAEG